MVEEHLKEGREWTRPRSLRASDNVDIGRAETQQSTIPRPWEVVDASVCFLDGDQEHSSTLGSRVCASETMLEEEACGVPPLIARHVSSNEVWLPLSLIPL